VRGASAERENTAMRALIATILIVYLVGVGIALAPAVRTNWNNVPASELASTVGRSWPDALASPARAYRSVTT
jgi:hypothetical protein